MGKLTANSNLTKNNKISIKKENLGGGKINLYKFYPNQISSLKLWTAQGGLNRTNYNYKFSYLSFNATADYDIDVNYYLDCDSCESYTGEEFGWTITYDGNSGLWYLNDPNTESDAAAAFNITGPWYVYSSAVSTFSLQDSDTIETQDYDYYYDTWSDLSGNNNNLTTRFSPRPQGNGIETNILSNTEFKKLNKNSLRTSQNFDPTLPFSIYMVFFKAPDSQECYIFGNNNFNIRFSYPGTGLYYNILLQYYNSGINNINIGTITWVTNTTIIIKILSNYNTTPSSSIRKYNFKIYGKGLDPIFSQNVYLPSSYYPYQPYISANNLFIGNKDFNDNQQCDLRFAEIIYYNKFLNNEEDRLVSKYLEQKYL